MRHAFIVAFLLLWLPGLAAQDSIWERREQLQNEDLASIRAWMRKKHPELDWFWVLDKRPVESGYSVMLMEAAPLEQRPSAAKPGPAFARARLGLFVVYGRTNQVYMVLDDYAKGTADLAPELEPPATGTAVYLHFVSDYGFYHGSAKYIYDLKSRKPAQKIRYGRLAVLASERAGGKLYYAAAFPAYGQAQNGFENESVLISLQPGPPGELPSYAITEVPGADPESLKQRLPAPPAVPQPTAPEAVLRALPLRPEWQPAPEKNLLSAGQGRWVFVDQTEQSGLYLIRQSGRKEFFPVPVPGLALYRTLRASKGAVAQMPGPQESGLTNAIGPFALDGSTLWFANTFYDGEGTSGVGAIGSFDLETRKYEMRYLPEIAPWSGSVMLLEEDELWIGLMRRPEGATFGGGLLRYNRRTGAAHKYSLPDLIATIDRAGSDLYFGTSHGVYQLSGERLTQLRFEPDSNGQRVMIARSLQ